MSTAAPVAAPQTKSASVQFNTKTLNVAVVRESTNEYLMQIRRYLRDPIDTFFRALHKEARQAAEKSEDKSKSDLHLFREKLAAIPKWNAKTAEKFSNHILGWVSNKRFDLNKALRMVVVGRTMLLASVTGQNDPSGMDRVHVEYPDSSVFMHNALSLVASELIRMPSIVKVDKNDDENAFDRKKGKMKEIIGECLDSAVLDLLPSDSLNSYLESSLRVDHFESTKVEQKKDEYGFEKEDGQGMTPQKEEDQKKLEETKKVVAKNPPPEDGSAPQNAAAPEKESGDEESSSDDDSDSSSSDSDGEKHKKKKKKHHKKK